MIDAKNPPYPPGSYVFFTDNHGVKTGKVLAINIKTDENGSTTTWAIEETIRQGDGNTESIIYQRDLTEIAADWTNILERAQAKIFSYKYAQDRAAQNDGIF